MLNIPILFVDDDLLVVEKPSGLLSVPGRGEEKQDCLIARLLPNHPDALIVHRLDQDTSGLLVIARGKAMHRALSMQFMERKVYKEYVAWVLGEVLADSGTIDLPLCVDWKNRPRHHVNFKDGKPAQTRYQKCAFDAQDNSTRMRLIPETGRTHQLRVHMLSIKHPILGDRLYASEEGINKSERLLLHATLLNFTHPRTGERLSFVSPFER